VSKRRKRGPANAAAEPVSTDGIRHLQYALPRVEADDPYPHQLVLIEGDGTAGEVGRYTCQRTFGRIERDGRMWRLAGQDRQTGEFVYLPEADVA
jgi:hypothetical protein